MTMSFHLAFTNSFENNAKSSNFTKFYQFSNGRSNFFYFGTKTGKLSENLRSFDACLKKVNFFKEVLYKKE